MENWLKFVQDMEHQASSVSVGRAGDIKRHGSGSSNQERGSAFKPCCPSHIG
jgi:hypothetical protein